jgi:hypothetical protein
MIYRILNNKFVEVDLSDIDYEKDEYGGESASFRFEGDAYFLPDYFVEDEFILRFLRRFGITDNFQRHFEVDIADAWDVLEAL